VDFRHVPPDQSQVKCAYCGTLITIPGRAQAAPAVFTAPVQRSKPTIVASSDGRLVKGGWGCGVWMVVILIVAVVGFSLWSTTFITSATRTVSNLVSDGTQNDPSSDAPAFTLSTFDQALAPKPRLMTAPMMLRGDDHATTQIVTAAYQEHGSILVGFDPVNRVETWRSPLLGEKYYDMGMSADAARVYVADGAALMALDRATGKILWQSSLANNLQTGCNASAPCLQIVGEQLVALARDGTAQGFNGATGAPAWSRRLNSQPRQFLTNNNQVIFVDTDDSNHPLILVLDATTGDIIYNLQPSCVFPNSMEMRPNLSDQYLITPDGSALLIVGSGTYACAWRYDLTSGALTWSYRSPDVLGALPFTWSMSSLAVADPVVYFVNDEDKTVQVYALDTQIQDSTPQPLYSIKGYKLTVQYPLGDLLLVSAQPDYATDEVELWAIDRNTGERRWQCKLDTTHTFDEWVTHPTEQGIFVSVCYWNTDDCRFEVLDLATGTSQGEVRATAGNSFAGAAWRGNEGFLTIDGKLYAINLATGAIEYSCP
jgi:outer membrane protein assembly factor BamB